MTCLILMECKAGAHIMLCVFLELMPTLIYYSHQWVINIKGASVEDQHT